MRLTPCLMLWPASTPSTSGRPTVAKRPHVFHGSDWLSSRELRRRVRQLLRRGIEPEPRYATGKFWTD